MRVCAPTRPAMGENNEITSWTDRVAGQLISLPASEPAARSGPVVRVLVQGVSLLLPGRALCIGLADLRSTTEEYVSPERYAQGVPLVLVALANAGAVELLPSLFQVPPPDSDSSPS
jgi:hypothetical protein